MDGYAFALETLEHGSDDTLTVFRHLAQMADDRFGEATHSWPDQRGRTFSRTILLPSHELVPATVAALSVHRTSLFRSRDAATASEAAMRDVALSVEAVELSVLRAQRAQDEANHLSATALGRAQAATSTAQRTLADVQQLGGPPI